MKNFIAVSAAFIIACLTSISCSKEEPDPSLVLSENSAIFGPDAGTKSISVTSNTIWKVNVQTLPTWIKSIEQTADKGNGEVKISVKENKSRSTQNNWVMNIEYAGRFRKSVKIIQEAAINNAPSKPVILTPADNSTGISVIPEFSWKRCSDPEIDNINYSVHISEDGNNWTEFPAKNNTRLQHSSRFVPLKPNTEYMYKVSADDGYPNGIVYSDVFTFTTSQKDAYLDEEYVLYSKSTKEKPFILVFTGDGYLPEHHKYGGLFDQDMNFSIEALFEIEPYKSYREYFTVYKLAAYSNETGVTNIKTGVTADTKYKSTWNGGNSTYISAKLGSTAIFNLCKTIPEFLERGTNNAAVNITVNADVYAGTCTMWSTGASIAVSTYNRNGSSTQTRFENTIRHELGGHGIGRLGDEYKSSNDTISQEAVESLLEWQGYGCYLNKSIEPLIENSPWSHFAGLEGYSHVGMWEGAGYKYGVWRPEETSCMISNLPYYNSPSRFWIVKRLLETAGEVIPTVKGEPLAVRASKLQKILEIFIPKDKQKTNPYGTSSSSNTKAAVTVPYDIQLLAEPVLIVGSPD